MRLLLFGLYKPEEPQQALRDALKGICDQYHEHSWARDKRKPGNDLMRLVRDCKPDVVFMQVQHPGVITGKILKQYPGIKFFNFSGDVREQIPDWYFDVAPYCTTLFTNTDWVDEMISRGFRARYFQVGFEHNIYKPEGTKEITKPVVFMGNNHGLKFPLSGLRDEMVKRFSKKDWFQVYGRGWPGAIDLNYHQQREAAVYRGAKIGINLSHLDLGSYTSDRMFRIMGSGCFCLAYRHKGIEKEFEEHKQLDTWASLDELEALIEFHLNSPFEGFAAAMNGTDYVRKNYTWKARIEKDLIPLL